MSAACVTWPSQVDCATMDESNGWHVCALPSGHYGDHECHCGERVRPTRPLCVERTHIDELTRVVGSTRVLALPQRELAQIPEAGEWDWLRAMPTRLRRSLMGAGWLTTRGERPDVAADIICDRVGGLNGIDDAMRWYVRLAREAIREARRDAHARRHQRYARKLGYETYYVRRLAQAQALGFASVWHMRRGRGWS